ncbi:MAG: serine/threonine-protein kinase [Planctomycetota bacterium]
MNTIPPTRCPSCSAEIPADAPQGLCPQCLLRGVASLVDSPAFASREQPKSGSASSPAGGQSRPPFSAERRDPPSIEELATAFPHLEILELIGRGGMGFVYKARQTKLDRLVALKILPGHLANEPSFHERFEREARVLAKLQHPLIVSVYDFGEVATHDAGSIFYLMLEYVDGVNLREAMRAGRFTPEQALAIVPQVCDALQYAHSRGVLHRDIKPENILLDSDGRVKIADFGIAKVLDPNLEPTSGLQYPGLISESEIAVTRLTATGSVLGTPLYMAPEQLISPNAVDHRADIYSLGVVFYEMLTGELPMGRFAPPSAKSMTDRQIDLRVDEIVMRALAKERELRQQSAGEMKTEVETVSARVQPSTANDRANDQAVPPPPASPPASFYQDPWKVVLALLCLCFLPAVISLVLYIAFAPVILLNVIVFEITSNELGAVAGGVLCIVVDLILASIVWNFWLKKVSPRRAGLFVRRLFYPDDPLPSQDSRSNPATSSPEQDTYSGRAGWWALIAAIAGYFVALWPMVTIRAVGSSEQPSTAPESWLIGIILVILSSLLALVVPIGLGWRHLIRQRHKCRREGIIPALVAAWALPLQFLDVSIVLLIYSTLESLQHNSSTRNFSDLTTLAPFLAGFVCLVVDVSILVASWQWVTQSQFFWRRPSTTNATSPSFAQRICGLVLIAVAVALTASWYAYVSNEVLPRRQQAVARVVEIDNRLVQSREELASLSQQLEMAQTLEGSNALQDSISRVTNRMAELRQERIPLIAMWADNGAITFLPYSMIALPLVVIGCAMIVKRHRVMLGIGAAVCTMMVLMGVSRWISENQRRNFSIAPQQQPVDRVAINQSSQSGQRSRLMPTAVKEAQQLRLINCVDYPCNVQRSQQPIGIVVDNRETFIEPFSSALIRLPNSTTAITVSYQVGATTRKSQTITTAYPCDYVACDWTAGNKAPLFRCYLRPPGAYDVGYFAPRTPWELLPDVGGDLVKPMAPDEFTSDDRSQIATMTLELIKVNLPTLQPITESDWINATRNPHLQFSLLPQAITKLRNADPFFDLAADGKYGCLAVLTEQSTTLMVREGHSFTKLELQTPEPIRRLHESLLETVQKNRQEAVKLFLDTVQRAAMEKNFQTFRMCLTDDGRDEWDFNDLQLQTKFLDLASFSDLVIEHDIATGKWTDKSGEQRPLVLRRIAGKWKIDSLIGKIAWDVYNNEKVPRNSDDPADALRPENSGDF